ncbi:hypothetical protein BDV11DRAFT_190907 [Aspergillus similis]
MSMADSIFTGSHRSSLKATLHRAQQAPAILGQRPSILHQKSPSDFDSLENLFFACIQSADDKCALSCLERLAHHFGSSNERVSALRSLYDEAVAQGQPSLERCLKTCDDILSQNPVNLPILKRRIALLRSLSRYTDAISGLVQLLEATPTDAEAWCELAELYQSQGLSPQAIFSLEEALLIVPHAWNVHARLGEFLYVYANSLDNEGMRRQLRYSIQHFCRSIELCEDYLRGFYGLAVATSRILVEETPETTSGYPKLGQESFRRLQALATEKLSTILKMQYSLAPHLRDYEENELAAVKVLLSGSGE